MLNYSESIPLIIFGLIVMAIFLFSLWGISFILGSSENEEKKKKGRKILLSSLYGLFIIFLMIITFFTVTYLTGKGKKLEPSSLPGEFPPSPTAVNNILPPRFIKIGGYYFNGPWEIRDSNVISTPGLYTVLCKNNNKYNIIYMGKKEASKESLNLFKGEQYNCWLDHCGKEVKNLYTAFFWKYSEKYNDKKAKNILEGIKNKINLPCPAKTNK